MPHQLLLQVNFVFYYNVIPQTDYISILSKLQILLNMSLLHFTRAIAKLQL